MLDGGLLLSADLTRQMKDVLSNPGIHHKFVKGLESRGEVRLYRKSGTWQQFHSDSALVEGPNRRYVLVGLAGPARRAPSGSSGSPCRSTTSSTRDTVVGARPALASVRLASGRYFAGAGAGGVQRLDEPLHARGELHVDRGRVAAQHVRDDR